MYENYVDAHTLSEQVYKVEGVGVDIKQFAGRKKNKLDKLRYPAYPYDKKFNGNIEDLIKVRILPIIAQEKEVD